jgi:hypothetical protein
MNYLRLKQKIRLNREFEVRNCALDEQT